MYVQIGVVRFIKRERGLLKNANVLSKSSSRF